MPVRTPDDAKASVDLTVCAHPVVVDPEMTRDDPDVRRCRAGRQRVSLAILGVEPSEIYVDLGLTGGNRDRPGSSTVRAGDQLVVTKLDCLARSIPDARDIVDELTTKGVVLNLGGSTHDPTDPVGRLMLNVLSMVAEFEADLIRVRTREGMAIAKANGRLKGKRRNSPCRSASS